MVQGSGNAEEIVISQERSVTCSLTSTANVTSEVMNNNYSKWCTFYGSDDPRNIIADSPMKKMDTSAIPQSISVSRYLFDGLQPTDI